MSHLNARIATLLTRVKTEDRGSGPVPEGVMTLGITLMAVALVAALNAVFGNFIGRLIGITP